MIGSNLENSHRLEFARVAAAKREERHQRNINIVVITFLINILPSLYSGEVSARSYRSFTFNVKHTPSHISRYACRHRISSVTLLVPRPSHTIPSLPRHPAAPSRV